MIFLFFFFAAATVLADSVAVCLLDLSLEPFVLEIIQDAPDIIPMLGNSDDERRFTVFALTTEALDQLDPMNQVDALCHIANKTVDKKHLGDFSVYPSVKEDSYLHVVQGVDTKVKFFFIIFLIF